MNYLGLLLFCIVIAVGFLGLMWTCDVLVRQMFWGKDWDDHDSAIPFFNKWWWKD